MKETKKFDKWIGILSISVICIVAIVFVLVVSDTHLTKGTYGADDECTNTDYIHCEYELAPGALAGGCNCSCTYTSESQCESVTGKPCNGTYVGNFMTCWQPVASSSSSSGVQVKTTGCYSCNSGVRYLTAGSTFPELCNTAAPMSGYAMNGYDSYCHRVETPSASSVAPDPSGVVYVYFSNAEGTETKKTCKTGTDGKLDSSCISSLSGICGSWSTSYCPNHTCDSNNTQTFAYSTSGLANVKFTVATRFYCFAGSSVHPGDPSNPSTSSVKPNSSSVKPSSSSVKPSSVSSKSESTVPSNPPTGTTGIIIAWIIGLFAIGYSFWYFKRTSTN